MKNLFKMMFSVCLAVATATSVSGFVTAAAAESLTNDCKAAYLIDYNSGECIYSENENAHMPIASVCKVMTLTLCFDAIANGELSLEDKITVGENASGMGGSQVFLDKGLEYSADQLIKSVIVCSANDSCVALSERIAGSEEEFVSRMNKKATELGCADTVFANCTGLPRETQYSCAKDVAIMFRNLLKYDSYFEYSRIWLEDFVHPDNRTTSMTNTNKLIKKYSYCDGGKTGFTNEAGFCLASTAKKGDLRLVSVVLGATTSNDRFNSAIRMFEYGFANYKNRIVLDKDVVLNEEFSVTGGKKETFSVRPERNCYVFSGANQTPEITHNIINYNVKAPVLIDQVVGEIGIFKDGTLVDTVNIVAAENVAKAGFGDYFRRSARDWAV